MSVQTHLDPARTRVQTEQEALEAKITSFETFISRMADVPAKPNPAASMGVATTTGVAFRSTSSTDERIRTVRTIFDDTIRPHCVDDGDGPLSLQAAIRSEFGDAIATALAPTTESRFSDDLRRTIVSKADSRWAETVVLRWALRYELRLLNETAETVDEITTWIVDADETPLTDLDFEALQRRHERIAAHRERCAEFARKRQAFLRTTTSHHADVGIRHRTLIPYLYRDFPVDHPVLATIVRLDDICATCQRAVRDHLIRRS